MTLSLFVLVSQIFYLLQYNRYHYKLYYLEVYYYCLFLMNILTFLVPNPFNISYYYYKFLIVLVPNLQTTLNFIVDFSLFSAKPLFLKLSSREWREFPACPYVAPPAASLRHLCRTRRRRAHLPPLHACHTHGRTHLVRGDQISAQKCTP